MKFDLNKNILVLTFIFFIAFAIRLYQLSFFEFHYDQYYAIGLGNNTRAAFFTITHGMCSGLGLDNPPFFLYIMGVLTAFTNDPAQLTSCFFCINLLALIITIIYFYRTLPGPYAILSTAFLALFPAFTIYSNNIWAQCILPLIMILFNISFYRIIKYERWRNFLYMGLLVVLAAQIHGVGFMLYPLLILIAVVYREKIDKKVTWLTFLVTIVLFIPFLIHLLKGNELSKVLSYGFAGHRGFQWKILPFHFRMASFEFFRSYFKFDFKQILKIIAGNGSVFLYPLTLIPGILFILGIVEYMRWLIKGKIFDKSESSHPLPFQISGLMILVVTLGLMIFRISASLHYCIVLFPAYSILTGFVAFKIWRYYWGKLLVTLGILSTVILLVGILLFIDRAGGHPYEYGVSYKTLVSWQKEIQAMKGKGEYFDIKVHLINQELTDLPAIASVLNRNNRCQPGDKIIPVQINIGWNEKLMRYEAIFSNHLN